MPTIPPKSTVIRSFFFILIAGSKTLTNIGQSCLTVDTLLSTIHCLSHDKNTTLSSDDIASINLSSNISQIIAAFFSTTMIVLTRYPSIWKKLSINHLSDSKASFYTHYDTLNFRYTMLLGLISVFGLLSCVSRGISAYLFSEILFKERWKIEKTTTTFFSMLSALTVTISCLCFNFSNMMASAMTYCKKPQLNCKAKDIMPVIATISNAVAMRFFMLHFLNRQQASYGLQITGQILFPLSEFAMGLFTMVASFQEGWQSRMNQNLKYAWLFTCLVIGDGLTTWLGYYTVIWYSIFTEKSSNPYQTNSTSICQQHENTENITTKIALLGAACIISLPATLSYFHYLLEYAFETYKGWSTDIQPYCRTHSKEENVALLSIQ